MHPQTKILNMPVSRTINQSVVSKNVLSSSTTATTSRLKWKTRNSARVTNSGGRRVDIGRTSDYDIWPKTKFGQAHQMSAKHLAECCMLVGTCFTCDWPGDAVSVKQVSTSVHIDRLRNSVEKLQYIIKNIYEWEFRYLFAKPETSFRSLSVNLCDPFVN